MKKNIFEKIKSRLVLSATLVFSAFLTLIISNESAAIVRWSQPQNLQSNLRTHIVIAGRGGDQGYQFQQVALSQINKLKDVFPSDQILLITLNETGYSDQVARLKAWGFSDFAIDGQELNDKNVIREIENYTQIASLHFIGHNNPYYGTQLEGKNTRLNHNSVGIDRLASHFTSGAFAVFHGCNSGFFTTPDLSKRWGIPVMGSLTSTAIQRLHKNGTFYANDPGLYPEGGWSTTNQKSFTTNWSCPSGACLRLQPDNIPYSGMWGNFSSGGGLPNFKPFCKSLPENVCLKGLYNFARSWVGSTNLGSDINLRPSKELYWSFLKDYFCPSDAKGIKRTLCHQKLQETYEAGQNYSPFAGNNLYCTIQGCQFQLKCMIRWGGMQVAPCKLLDTSETKSNSVSEDLQLFWKAFNDFSGQQH